MVVAALLLLVMMVTLVIVMTACAEYKAESVKNLAVELVVVVVMVLS